MTQTTTGIPPKEGQSIVPSSPAKAVQESSVEAMALKLAAETDKMSGAIRPEVRPHAFVIMPFGKKKGSDGSIFDFNAIYNQLIKPSLEAAGFEAFRADEETASGDILTDMFQELLLADLCIADMSIDNANVFYELGIRHALRKRGVVHIQAGRAYMPFDVFNVRTIPYHITPEGVPDPEYLEKDKSAISRVTLDTWASDHEAIHSPIFNLLDGLAEPDRRMLRTPLAKGFWSEYDDWRDRVSVAQRQKRLGDILLLTEEIRNPLIREEALGEAGRALKNMGRHELALSQYRKGLEVNPRNFIFRREEAFCLNRLGRADEAIVRLESLLADVPSESEVIAYLGRIYKEIWYDSWKEIADKDQRLKMAFDSYHWLIKAFETYLKGYRLDLNETYPAVNALTLGKALIHLADRFDDKQAPDPEIQWVRNILPELEGALIFTLESRARDETADYWTLISLAEMYIYSAGAVPHVSRAHRKALTASRRNQFYLQSTLDQLEMLRLLDLRGEFVRAGINVLRGELNRIRREKHTEEDQQKKRTKKTGTAKTQKRQSMVFLFTGYMVSYEGKSEHQFPAEKEQDIRQAINLVLDRHDAGPNDLAITTGLDAGSEILFVECCTERGIFVEAYFPVSESAYVRDFVSPAGEGWVDRYYSMRNHPRVNEYYQPDCVGLPREGDNLHERNNRWALYSALAYGIDNVRLVAVWDGHTESCTDLDARLVRHMVDLMHDTGGMVEQINPGKLSRITIEPVEAPLLPGEAVEVKSNAPLNGSSSKRGLRKKK
jgi:tetratricopeptide (TPR) repeat protein